MSRSICLSSRVDRRISVGGINLCTCFRLRFRKILCRHGPYNLPKYISDIVLDPYSLLDFIPDVDLDPYSLPNFVSDVDLRGEIT